MIRWFITGVCSGILFGMLDGFIHANPYARKLYEIYRPIARESVNVPAGIAIDLFYGLALAAMFLLLRGALPGNALVKGALFGSILWFLRVAMAAAGQWMMFQVPTALVLYTLATGLVEMLVLGLVYGLTLNR